MRRVERRAGRHRVVRRDVGVRALLGLVLSVAGASALPAGAAGEQASQPAAASAGGLDVGFYHACALLSSGGVRCWGYGGNGALGYASRNTIGDDESPAAADPVDVGRGRSATAVATGDVHSCALLDDRSVSCWGFGGDGRLGYSSVDSVGDDEAPSLTGPVVVGGPATAVTAGAGHTCAVLERGSVRCWGNGRSGALGYGNTDSIGDDETPGSLTASVDVGASRTATAISAGFEFTCALLDARPDVGNVRCWGASGGVTERGGSNGQLGVPNRSDDPKTANIGDDETPGSVDPIDLGATATAISAGDHHACAILAATGGVRCWGLGANGRLGYVSTDTVGDDETPGSVGPVDLGGAATAISAGGKHTCAILQDGSVRCWGSNRAGQLGYPSTGDVGDDETPASVGPVDLGPTRTAVAISAGKESTCARLDDGSVRCWGYAAYGRLGYCSPLTIGDDETPAAAGPVNIEGANGFTGCGAAPAAAIAAPADAAATAGPLAAAPPPAIGQPAPADDGLAAQKIRAAALRACMRVSSRRARARRREARRLSRSARAVAMRSINSRAARERRQCQQRHGRTPGRVTTLGARATGRHVVVLAFRAVGTDHDKPPAATTYLVKQSERPIRTLRAFDAAPVLCRGKCAFAVTEIGARISLKVDRLAGHSTYYYAIAARDNVSGRIGPRSESISVRTR